MARSHPSEDAESVYVWEFPVRLTHWLLVFSILVLSATGYYIGHPFISVQGQARYHFVMGTMRAVHLYAAIVFTLAVFVRLYWMIVGNTYSRLNQFIPFSRERLLSMFRTFEFYSFISPNPVEYPGHNALAASSYGFIQVVYIIMAATGLALYTAVASASSPFQVFQFLVPLFDGLQMARLIHHIGMWIILVFVVAHLYFITLASIIERNGTIDSIFSGYKFMPRRRPISGE